MAKNITALFNKFAGREVPMKEVLVKSCIVGEDPVIDAAPVNPKDPTLKAMKKIAIANGLTLRVLWPGKPVTEDYSLSRVNAHIEKAADGKWRISGRFDIG